MGFLRRRGRFSDGTLVMVAILALASTTLAAGCGGGGESPARSVDDTNEASSRQGDETANGTTAREEDASANEDTTAGEASADKGGVSIGPDGTVVAGGVTIGPDGEVSGEGDQGTRSSGEMASNATLTMRGDAGTTFSGVCEFGKDKVDLGGKVPESFDLRLDGRALECDIFKKGGGKLTLVLDTGDSRSEFQATNPNTVVKIKYSSNGVSMYSRSSGGDRNSSVVQGSSSSVQQRSVQGGGGQQDVQQQSVQQQSIQTGDG